MPTHTGNGFNTEPFLDATTRVRISVSIGPKFLFVFIFQQQKFRLLTDINTDITMK